MNNPDKLRVGSGMVIMCPSQFDSKYCILTARHLFYDSQTGDGKFSDVYFSLNPGSTNFLVDTSELPEKEASNFENKDYIIVPLESKASSFQTCKLRLNPVKNKDLNEIARLKTGDYIVVGMRLNEMSAKKSYQDDFDFYKMPILFASQAIQSNLDSGSGMSGAQVYVKLSTGLKFFGIVVSYTMQSKCEQFLPYKCTTYVEVLDTLNLDEGC